MTIFVHMSTLTSGPTLSRCTLMASATRRDEIMNAANRVFLRFGYRRTTMGDLAEEAGISRPALYLVFPSKEEIFNAVLARVFQTELDEIRAGTAKLATPAAKILFALEVWCVRNYELTRASPGASDLYESSFEFAGEVANKSTTAFEAILTEIIEPLVRKQSRVTLAAREIARLISS